MNAPFSLQPAAPWRNRVKITLHGRGGYLLLVIFAPHIMSMAMQSSVAAGVAQALAAGSREIFL
jgi:hypothetical protein